jgi:two-component system, NarL family, invasion response regulator UvrY
VSGPAASERPTGRPVGATRRSVLLVDDHRGFRVVVRSLLDAEPGFEVVGEARDGEEAVELAGRLGPDLVVMDVRLPGITGMEATRRILARDPSVVVVLVSTVRREDLPADLLGCGAVGFLQKEALDPSALEELVAGG